MRLIHIISLVVISAFLSNTIFPDFIWAQDYQLPAPGVMVPLSPQLDPPLLKGIKVNPDNPFRFDFILDKGDSTLNNDQLKNESNKMIKYFLASMTIPENDLWVNLSPYEKDRIIPQSFALTEMGRDLLAEDYMLKQVTASLIYPEDAIGKKFWRRIYEEASKEFGTTNIPVNTFNKVWIVPEKAVVYENASAGTAYVVESKLKVMLEQDYLSLQKHEGISSAVYSRGKETNQLGSQIVREVVIPELTKEVNEGKNFVKLRQVYNSLILAAWYKKKIKDSVLSLVYADKNKVAGVNINDPKEKERIYQKYLKAFKKGVYSYIKEDIDPVSQQAVPRKYFSGGIFGAKIDEAMTVREMTPEVARNLGKGVGHLFLLAAAVILPSFFTLPASAQSPAAGMTKEGNIEYISYSQPSIVFASDNGEVRVTYEINGAPMVFTGFPTGNGLIPTVLQSPNGQYFLAQSDSKTGTTIIRESPGPIDTIYASPAPQSNKITGTDGIVYTQLSPNSQVYEGSNGQRVIVEFEQGGLGIPESAYLLFPLSKIVPNTSINTYSIQNSQEISLGGVRYTMDVVLNNGQQAVLVSRGHSNIAYEIGGLDYPGEGVYGVVPITGEFKITRNGAVLLPGYKTPDFNLNQFLVAQQPQIVKGVPEYASTLSGIPFEGLVVSLPSSIVHNTGPVVPSPGNVVKVNVPNLYSIQVSEQIKLGGVSYTMDVVLNNGQQDVLVSKGRSRTAYEIGGIDYPGEGVNGVVPQTGEFEITRNGAVLLRKYAPPAFNLTQFEVVQKPVGIKNGVPQYVSSLNGTPFVGTIVKIPEPILHDTRPVVPSPNNPLKITYGNPKGLKGISFGNYMGFANREKNRKGGSPLPTNEPINTNPFAVPYASKHRTPEAVRVLEIAGPIVGVIALGWSISPTGFIWNGLHFSVDNNTNGNLSYTIAPGQQTSDADRAMPTGGIDLTANNLNLQLQNAGKEIKFNVNPAMLAQLKNVPGFTSVVVGMQSMTELSLKEFLGV